MFCTEKALGPPATVPSSNPQKNFGEELRGLGETKSEN